MKSVCVVILNYRNWQDTVECLTSLLADPYRPRGVVVVDNASPNDSVPQIKRWAAGRGLSLAWSGGPDAAADAAGEPDLVLIEAGQNGGYAAGNNVGIRHALSRRFDQVLLLNNDTLVEPGFLSPLVQFMESHPQCGVAGPRIVGADGALDRSCARRRPPLADYFFRVGPVGVAFPSNRWVRRHYYLGEYDFEKPMPVDVLSGACMLIRREVLESIGLLDEGTFLYLEEFILHERLRETSFGSFVVPESRVVHKGAQSTGGDDNPALHAAQISSLRYYLRRYRGFSAAVIALILLNFRLGWLLARAGRR